MTDMIATTKEDWTPVQNGKLYCSPACGSKCTLADNQKAMRLGGVLARALGEGWLPHVWENMGWHYAAKKGVCEVHPAGGGGCGYTAFLNTFPQVVKTGRTPRDALLAAVSRVEEIREKIAVDLAVISGKVRR